MQAEVGRIRSEMEEVKDDFTLGDSAWRQMGHLALHDLGFSTASCNTFTLLVTPTHAPPLVPPSSPSFHHVHLSASAERYLQNGLRQLITFGRISYYNSNCAAALRAL